MPLDGLEEGRSALGRSLLERKTLASDWVLSFAAIPRGDFLPEVMWPYDMESGTTVTVDMREEPGLRFSYADADVPIVTQWDDGKGDGRGTVPTSSASMPSVGCAVVGAVVHIAMRVGARHGRRSRRLPPRVTYPEGTTASRRFNGNQRQKRHSPWSAT